MRDDRDDSSFSDLKIVEKLTLLEERSRFLHKELDRKVNLERFTLIEKLVFGLFGLLVTSFIGLIIERIFLNG